jgi:hypothetical protein
VSRLLEIFPNCCGGCRFCAKKSVVHEVHLNRPIFYPKGFGPTWLTYSYHCTR